VFEDVATAPPNHVRFRLSPDVVIELAARAKQPGESNVGEEVHLDACRNSINTIPPYQRLLADAMRGDQMLFARTDAVQESWRVVEPVLTARTPVHSYDPGSWGPARAAAMIPGTPWYDPA
jgi:glucose-6-phosphate 1-dehydrogenase